MQPFIPHFIQKQYLANHFQGSIEGCVLFVDISGFTPMTKQLMEKGQKEGAEVLSNILNSIFEVMIQEVYQAKGFITHFSGDAFTAIFPQETSASPKTTAFHALQCVKNIQEFFLQNGLQNSKYGAFQLQVKMGLSYGRTKWGIVGNEEITGIKAHKCYFQGQAINEATTAEKKAQKGETILSESFQKLFNKQELRGKILEDHFFRLEVISLPSFEYKEPSLTKIQASILERFIPDEVIAFREKGEFRNIISVFISFKGIETHEELNIFTSIVLKHIIRYKGDLKEMDFGDKGALMVGFFGAPVTHENDLVRALYFVEEVTQEVREYKELERLQFRIGMTAGKVYAGIIGGKYRSEYTCLGNIVNIAARITMRTPWQEIWVNDVIAAHLQFRFEPKGEFYYKGFPIPIKTHRYLGKASNRSLSKNGTILIGRAALLDSLNERMQAIFEGESAGISYVFGEAGIGKSRLIFALKEKIMNRANWFQITSDPILQKPFQPFKDLLSSYFQSSKLDKTASKHAHFETVFEGLLLQLEEKISALSKHKKYSSEEELRQLPLQTILTPLALLKDAHKELKRTKSILASQIGIHLPDPLLHQLDAKGKYENTILSIQNLLKALSFLQPLILHLEDSQWLDVDSIALLQKMSNNLSQYPIAILSTARYKDDGSPAILPLKGVRSHQIDLDYLQKEEVKYLAET